jgi:hypothetical protein
MRSIIRGSKLVLGLLIFPAALAQAQFTVQNGAVISTNGGAVIALQDIDLIVDGSIAQHTGDGFWIFTGSGNNTISGSNNPLFDVLKISKTGSSKLSLSQTVKIAGSIEFNTGLIDLNNNNFLLQPGGTLVGENESSHIMSSNGGYIEATAVLNAPIGVNPGNLGAVITSSQNLGSTIIRRGHGSQTGSGGAGSSILRYYDILPANDNALDATLRINYLDAELNSLDENSLVLWKTTDQLHWTNIGFSVRDASAHYLQDTGISDFSRWTLSTINNPLPIKLASFAVECLNGLANIVWKTVGEQNTSRFDVERSTDGTQWQTIGNIAAAGYSQQEKDYSFTDGNATPGSVFYRIVEIDLDGAVSYSTTASAKCALVSDDPVIYPNPVRDILWLSMFSPGASDIKMDIFNANGASVGEQINRLNAGANKIGIDMKPFAPGIYFINIQWDNGHRAKVVKLTRLN